MRKKILVLCHDVIGEKMAGPGMRYARIAEVLGKQFTVILGVTSEANKGADHLVVVDPENDGYKAHFDAVDVIFAQWLSNPMIEYAKSTGKRIVFDLYAPVPIEYLASLEFASDPIPAEKDEEFNAILAMYNHYFSVGDLFVCSNDRQKDFWSGYVTANGLLGPSNFGTNNLLENFIIGPMGTSISPRPKELQLRKDLGLSGDDFVLVWTGGIWDWFDGQLVVGAMSCIKDRSIKLVFLGNKHPNSIYTKETTETTATRKLAAKLGLTDKTVFFRDGWIPYDQRTAYFMDGDAAVYADKQSLETRFSHRTRVLDHFWMELPTICTSGDYMSDVIERKALGLVVPQRTPEAFATAITTLKNDNKLRSQIHKNLQDHKNEFSWEQALQPLVERLAVLKKSKPVNTLSPETPAVPPKLSVKQRVKKSAKMLLLGR